MLDTVKFASRIFSVSQSTFRFVLRVRDRQRVVEVAERVKRPLLPLHGHEELLDAFQRQLVALDEDPDGVGHELARHLEDLVRQGGGDEDHLGHNK